MREARYAVHPGETTSKNDGQQHYIGVPQLVHLYGLRPGEYVVWDGRHVGRRWEDYLHLFPLYWGNYAEVIAVLRSASEEAVGR